VTAFAASPWPEPEISLRPYGNAVINDAALTDRIGKVFKAAFGDQAHPSPGPGTASEDFSEFRTEGVPILMFTVGATDPKVVAAAKAGGPPVPVNHSPYFAPLPEPTIKAAVEAMSLAVISLTSK
jgi:metal-dependent amidase/aminoacylase/carboxypeptidase family protein